MATAKNTILKKSNKPPVKKSDSIEKKSGKKSLWVGLGVLVLMLTGGGIVLVIKNETKKEEEEAKEKAAKADQVAQSIQNNSNQSSSTVKKNSQSNKASVTTPEVKEVSTAEVTKAVIATLSQTQAEAIAESFRRATYITQISDYGNNWPLLVTTLAKLKTAKDYELVNAVFLQISFVDRLKGEVSQSLVNKLTSTFGKYNAYRQLITKEFIRIGLKQQADGKWSLYGLGNHGDNRGRLVKAKSSLVALHKKTNEYKCFPEGCLIGHIYNIDEDGSTEIVNKEGVYYVPTESLTFAN